jgi:hypothetical protein
MGAEDGAKRERTVKASGEEASSLVKMANWQRSAACGEGGEEKWKQAGVRSSSIEGCQNVDAGQRDLSTHSCKYSGVFKVDVPQRPTSEDNERGGKRAAREQGGASQGAASKSLKPPPGDHRRVGEEARDLLEDGIPGLGRNNSNLAQPLRVEVAGEKQWSLRS